MKTWNSEAFAKAFLQNVSPRWGQDGPHPFCFGVPGHGASKRSITSHFRMTRLTSLLVVFGRWTTSPASVWDVCCQFSQPVKQTTSIIVADMLPNSKAKAVLQICSPPTRPRGFKNSLPNNKFLFTLVLEYLHKKINFYIIVLFTYF